jgi:hypothetical protein
MGELITGVMAGLIVSLVNKFIVNGQLWKMCDGRQPGEDDDGLSSQSSAIISDIHIHQ